MRVYFSFCHGNPRVLRQEQNTLWDECRRLTNPHNVYVDLSQKLYDLKTNLLNSYFNGI